MHADYFAGMKDVYVEAVHRMLREFGFQALTITYERHWNAEFPAGCYGSLNLNDGGIVPPHSINRYSHLSR